MISIKMQKYTKSKDYVNYFVYKSWKLQKAWKGSKKES